MWISKVHIFLFPVSPLLDNRPMHKSQRVMPQTIHIGNLIRDELRRQNRTNHWLAEQLGVNARTVNKIFQKSVIDTQQLMVVSQILHTDFFAYYSEALA